MMESALAAVLEDLLHLILRPFDWQIGPSPGAGGK